ncbi:MAG: IclR family transcriptional regulator [Bryobacterales bacterium]|nr:IclR family transcriptional regulator [Bryobacterales bacterium]
MKISQAGRTGYRAPALERGLDVLEFLARDAPRTQTEIARGLGKGPSEVFRMLAILEARGYIVKAPDSGAYSLTLKLFAMSHLHSPYSVLVSAAAQPMRALAQSIRESCHLTILAGSEVLVLAQQPSPAPVQVSVEPGALFPAFRTASGRLLLSLSDPAALAETLSSHPAYSELRPSGRKTVLARIAAAGRRGYEDAEEETYQGVYDLAVLIGSPGSPVVAALTAACLARKPRETRPALLEPLRACAARIAEKAGLA